MTPQVERLFDDRHIRRILECGERCGMQIHAVPTKKAVFQGFFSPPAYVDTSYFPDPREDDGSEWNAMQKLVALGFYKLHSHEMRDSHCYFWTATARGRELIAAFNAKGFRPERNPHAMATQTDDKP